jgi:hypothetical protein
MEIFKQYKTISLLVLLMAVLSILSVFVKMFDPQSLIPTSTFQTQSLTASTPTPIPDPFIHPETFNIQSSYMGYVVTKVANPDLGRAIMRYGVMNVDLIGSEWTIKKNGVSDFEYLTVKPYINNFVQQQVISKGWLAKTSVNGQELVPNLSKSDLSQGYIEVSDGKVQVAILQGGKDASGNAQFKLFLSDIYDLSTLQ